MMDEAKIQEENMARALEQVRVLDFTRAFAGPLCTLLLRQLGAEVIKVEIPGSGDAVRQLPPLTEGEESYIGIILNRGKKSITLNLQSGKGLQMAKDLAKNVDVVVENYSPGVMDKLGLGYEEVQKINPGVIYASSSGFGQTGPRRSDPAFDSIAQAAAGLMCVNGFPDRTPLRVGINIADYLAGICTAMAILAALRYRDKTGEGQAIDMSMQDIIWSLVSIEHSPQYFLTGKIPERTGNRTWVIAPSNNYPTKDGYVRVSASLLGQWDSLLTAMGRQDLIGLEKYSSIEGRQKHIDEIDALVEGWTRTKSTEELIEISNKAHVPCTPIPSFEQVVNDPQLSSRDMIVEVEQPISGKVKVPGSMFKMSKTPGESRSQAPFLGEHSYEVYSGILGYSEEEIRKFEDEGII